MTADMDETPEDLLAEEYKDPERFVVPEGLYPDWRDAQAEWQESVSSAMTGLRYRVERSRELLQQRRAATDKEKS